MISEHAKALANERAIARSAFLHDLRQCTAHMEDLLFVDDARRTPPTPERVAAAHGADAQRFLSVPRLTAVLERPSNKTGAMDDSRRQRCEMGLGTLRRALAEQESYPAVMQLSCTEALELCERQAMEIVPVLRALRIAKLEAVAGYDPQIHDEAFAHIEPRTAGLPAVLVVEQVERLAESTLTAFSRLLRSGRPVQIVVPAAGTPDIDIGAIALAHRGVFVLQSSKTRPEHLAKGLEEMARTGRPAVAVVYEEACPLYRYDPDREGEYADRFELAEAGPEHEMLRALAAKPVVAPPRDEESARQAYQRVLALIANPESQA